MKNRLVKTVGIFARVVGYYRPLSNWNVGKRQEWADRKLLKMKEMGVQQ